MCSFLIWKRDVAKISILTEDCEAEGSTVVSAWDTMQQDLVNIAFRLIIRQLIIIPLILTVSFINMKCSPLSKILWFVFKIPFSRKYSESRFLFC